MRKQISELESGLGVRLLHRTTRRMSLTESGAAYYEHCARTPQDLLKHRCLVYQNHASLSHGWPYKAGSKIVKVQVSGNCRINNSGALLELALAGAGIILSPAYILGPYVKSDGLKQILPVSVALPRHVTLCDLPAEPVYATEGARVH